MPITMQYTSILFSLLLAARKGPITLQLQVNKETKTYL